MLKILDKLYHNVLFNTCYVVATSLTSLWDSHIGWGLAIAYFAGAGWMAIENKKSTSITK